MLKAGAKIVPGDVYEGGMKGFVFLFRDEMTPRPFRECWGGWKTTLMAPGLIRHTLNMASPHHTYFRVDVSDNCDEIKAEGGDIPIAKLSWAPGNSPTYMWLQQLSLYYYVLCLP